MELKPSCSAVITRYEGKDASVSIPSRIDGHPVTAVGDSAFYNCRELKKLSIPKGITHIGASAFSWCTNLAVVSLPEGLESIGEGAFSWCYALGSIVIPDGIREIADSVFTRCGLTEATIPAELESLGDSSFSHCKKLAVIHFKGSSEQWERIRKDKDWNKKSNAAMEIEVRDLP